MKILFLSPESPFPPDHGHHLRTFNILKTLSNQNEIFFLGFAKHKRELEYVKELKKFCVSVDLLLVPEVKWKIFLSLLFNFFSPLPYTVQKFVHKKASKRIKQIVRENKIDIVHFDLLHMGTYYKDVRNLQKILENHNVESLRMLRWAQIEKNVLTKLYLYLQYLKLYRFEKTTCPKFDKCTVVSDFDQNVLMKMSPSASFVKIPNGVDVEYFKPQNVEFIENSLIWTGGLGDANNSNAVHYFLDEILPLIQLKIPNVKVRFLGKAMTTKVLSKAQENPNIQAIGYVDDVRPHIHRSSVFFAPLLSGSGTKLKVLNALSLGKAVVTTSIGAEGINVKNGENIVIADDPREFADKTVYLLQNPEIAKNMGGKARQVVEKYYDWRIIGQKIYNVYNNVCANL